MTDGFCVSQFLKKFLMATLSMVNISMAYFTRFFPVEQHLWNEQVHKGFLDLAQSHTLLPFSQFKSIMILQHSFLLYSPTLLHPVHGYFPRKT